MKAASFFITESDQFNIKRQFCISSDQVFDDIQSHDHPERSIEFTGIIYRIYMRGYDKSFCMRIVTPEPAANVPDIVNVRIQPARLHPGQYFAAAFHEGFCAESA